MANSICCHPEAVSFVNATVARATPAMFHNVPVCGVMFRFLIGVGQIGEMP